LSKIIASMKELGYANVASKYLGDILKKEGQFKEAIEHYKEAIDSRRGDFNAKIQFEIADLYEKLEDNESAIAEYMKVGYVYPDSIAIVVDSQLQAARLFEKESRWDDAERLYKKISVMDAADSEYARERLEWIKRNKN